MGKTKAKEAETTPSKIYPKEQVLKWYEEMLLIRRFEEKAGQIYGQGKIRGFCHLYIGQEAVAVGMESAIQPDDYVITAYRDHGNAIARGVSARACMAELYGKATGCTKGKGGSMHFFSKEHNFVGGHGIVGAQIGLGAGLAFACKYRKDNKIAVCLFGDGAARQGILHECFNLAMFWKLPVIFICENNKYAMGTSVERSSNVTEIYQLGAAYHMPSEQVNGMDVITVHERIAAAAEYARAGNGPMFLEIVTYRYKGHSMSDPGKYRTKEEVSAYQDQDPILKLKAYMLENDFDVSEEAFETIDERVKSVVKDAVDFSESSPYPDPSEIYTNVYIGDYPFIVD